MRVVTGMEPTTTGGTGETTVPDLESRTGASMRAHARRQASCDMVSFDELKSEFLPEEFTYRPGLLPKEAEILRIENERLANTVILEESEEGETTSKDDDEPEPDVEVRITETRVQIKDDASKVDAVKGKDDPDAIVRESIVCSTTTSSLESINYFDITISLDPPLKKQVSVDYASQGHQMHQKKKFSTISFMTPSQSSGSSGSCCSSATCSSSSSVTSESASYNSNGSSDRSNFSRTPVFV